MISKAKALTFALLAVCAFGALSASAASAAEFHVGGMGIAHGDGTQIAGSPAQIVFPEGALACPNAIFTGETLSNSSNVDQETTGQTATVTVTEGSSETLNCTFAGLSGTIVHMNGCDFRIHTGPPVQATVLCPPSQQITITAIVLGTLKCTIHIPAQGELSGITIVNNGGHSDIEVTAAVPSITYQSTTGSGLGACTNTTAGTDGKFSGKVTVQGTVSGAATPIQYS